MMEWRAVWRGVRSAEKQLSALLESGVPTAAKELTTHTPRGVATSYSPSPRHSTPVPVAGVRPVSGHLPQERNRP